MTCLLFFFLQELLLSLYYNVTELQPVGKVTVRILRLRFTTYTPIQLLTCSPVTERIVCWDHEGSSMTLEVRKEWRDVSYVTFPQRGTSLIQFHSAFRLCGSFQWIV